MDEHLLSGWVHKSNKTGARWKRRYVVVNSQLGSLAWFRDNP